MGVQPRDHRRITAERAEYRRSVRAALRTAAAVLPWVWGVVALVASVNEGVHGRWQTAVVQAVIAVGLLGVLPLARAYRRRLAYHRELAARADQEAWT